MAQVTCDVLTTNEIGKTLDSFLSSYPQTITTQIKKEFVEFIYSYIEEKYEYINNNVEINLNLFSKRNN